MLNTYYLGKSPFTSIFSRIFGLGAAFFTGAAISCKISKVVGFGIDFSEGALGSGIGSGAGSSLGFGFFLHQHQQQPILAIFIIQCK